MAGATIRRELSALVLLLGLLCLLSACGPSAPGATAAAATPQPASPVAATPTAEPTHTPTPRPVPSSTPTAAPTGTPTPTPAPTLHPGALTRDSVERLQRVQTLSGDGWSFFGVAVSGDGGLVAAGGSSQPVFVFDTRSGEMLHRLERHRSTVYSLDMTADASRLVSAGRDRTVQLWDPRSGDRLAGSRTHAELREVALSADGTRYATVGYYSALGDVWAAADGGRLFQLEGHETRLRSVAWSPDGQWLATGDQDGTILLRDPATGEPQVTLVTPDGEVTALAFSPDGETLAVGSGRNRVALWDIETGQEIARWVPHTGGVSGLLYTLDGSVLITAGGDGSVRLWDAGLLPEIADPNGLQARLATVGFHEGGCRGIDLSADGTTLVSAGADGLVFVWRLD